ncbi:hypothetical protein FPE01S_01_03560 [Flavihumibacter petaseus NBRC 106054]|uniref:Macroglobulin domain-containing protein n=2 Tax=Flavihumibacter TaxID=1004301 RepID=A0A0E9MUT8_9BACT|nr:hypothetical protein FPE01S_01_03560 [Flavihumibacter petaseus NBRC 106054]
MAAGSVVAQTSESQLREKFARYQQTRYQEKVFLHTDRNSYLSGETVWFSVYNVDGYLNRLSAVSRYLYVELLGADQKPALQQIVSLEQGRGEGTLDLPGDLPDGVYQLRAYTSWMKNFSPEGYYSRQLIIENAFLPAAKASSGKSKKRNIQFFPESGHLLDGIANQVAFKVINGYGEGEDVRGVLIRGDRDTIAAIQTTWKGMGKFQLDAKSGEYYHAVFSFPDTTIRVSLPRVEQAGYALVARDSGGEQIILRVQSAPVTGKSERLHLLVHTRQLVKAVYNLDYPAGTSITIDKSLLGEGISHAILFDSKLQPVGERLLWKQPAVRAPELQTDSMYYQRRSGVTLQLGQIPEENSVAVYLVGEQLLEGGNTIAEYLLASSELNGPVEFPDPAWQPADPRYSGALDLVLSTNGWSRFNPEEFTGGTAPLLQYLPEREGLLIHGQVTDSKTGRPAAGAEAFLSVPGTDFRLSEAVADTAGKLVFNLEQFYGNKELVTQAIDQSGSAYRVDLQPSFSDHFAGYFVLHHVAARPLLQLEESSRNFQLDRAFEVEKKSRVKDSVTNRISFYGHPDKVYPLDDYTRFPTTEEVLHEFIPEIRVRKTGDTYSFRVRNQMLNDYFLNEPLLLVDGVPVKHAASLMQLDPLRVKSIEIVMQKLFAGKLVREGVVSFKTYAGDLAGYKLPATDAVVNFQGLQQRRIFYSPQYEGQARFSRIPDRRELLYWEPRLKGAAPGRNTLRFFTSDVTGKYRVVLQGLDHNGQPYYAETFFEVK